MIISSESNKPRVLHLKEMGIDVIQIYSLSLGTKKYRGIWRHLKYLSCLPIISREAKKIINEHEIEYVYSYMPGTGSSYPAMRIKSKYKIPLVLDLADMYSMIKPKYIIKKSFKEADKILVITKYLKNDLLRQGIAENKILHVPNGVDLDIFNREKYSESEISQLRSSIGGEKLIVFAGSTQDLNIVIDSAGAVIGKYPKVKYLIIGDHRFPTKSKQFWENKVKEKKLNDNFIFLGRRPREEIPRYLLCADVCIDSFPNEPYYAAAHPIKLLEYGACGKPIVATQVEETANLITHGKHGLLANPENPTESAECLIKLLSDTTLAKKMGSEFEQYVKENFDWKIIVKKLASELI
jgi:glycosyltransferase involved in cell wall biosynthesis